MTEHDVNVLTDRIIKATISLSFFLLTQTLAAIWWASGLTSEVRWIKESLVTTSSELRLTQDAARSGVLNKELIARLEMRVDRIESQLEKNYGPIK